MSEQELRSALQEGRMICPECGAAITRYDNYAATLDAVRDGFNVVQIDSHGSRVTLICGVGDCKWKERTEYWTEYLDE